VSEDEDYDTQEQIEMLMQRIADLEEAIKDAPHEGESARWLPCLVVLDGKCNCWKSKILASGGVAE
jgi:hypothetical protein